ncbi:MAG: magnesium transporter [Alphaproteobacteria bacterium]|nr:magnesium transporter [Pseudomonadota bacterium]TDI67025.1 MAG: magnesium transporter [Alphaproteobacteria bacterium]
MSDHDRSQIAKDGGRDAAKGELYGVTREQIATFREALDAGDTERCEAFTLGLHVADLADLIEGLTAPERHILVALIGPHLDPELLAFLEEPVRDEVVAQMAPDDVAAAIGELDSDDAVEVIESLDQPVQAQVLERMEASDRVLVEEALAWPEDSAGRLMEREFVAVPLFWTVGDTIDYIRDEAEKGGGALPGEFFDLFVVDPAHHPVGLVSLSRLLRNRRPVRLEDIMDPELHAVPVATDQEEVALLFRQYDLASAPVVDEPGRLVGVITHDDVLDVIDEEAEEDIMRLGGVKEDDLYLAALKTSRARIPWLMVSTVSALIASLVIWQFEATIEELVALAILMPIVAGLGGNAGTQAMTVAVRALAVKDLNAANAPRIVGKEVIVGLFNGIILAALVGMVAAFWFASAGLGLIIAAALVVNLLVAGLMGILIPLILERAGADPAIASGVCLMTVTDVVGFSAFLGFAALFLA